LNTDLSIPDALVWVGVGTFPSLTFETLAWQVVKASSGHIPQPFLISNYCFKSWHKDNEETIISI